MQSRYLVREDAYIFVGYHIIMEVSAQILLLQADNEPLFSFAPHENEYMNEYYLFRYRPVVRQDSSRTAAYSAEP